MSVKQSSWMKMYCLIFILLALFISIPTSWAQDPIFSQPAQTIPPAMLVTSLPSAEENISANNIWADMRQHLGLQSQYQHPEVLKWIAWLKSRPKLLNELSLHAQPYIYYVYQQTQRYQMPAEFALLPMIESAYDPFAFSSKGAVGMWQMMPGTAMIYGLDINWWYDGRRDVISSTDRALNFLLSLQQSLGDWLLAAAAYDAGEETIQRAIANNPKNYQGSSFWYLSLPKETKEYVPKLLAIAAIIANPQKYGVNLPDIPNKPYFFPIKLDFQLDISEISHLAQLDIATIQQLNPGMRRFATSPDQHYVLLLPIQNAQIFLNSLARVAGQYHVTWQYHEVHMGQTLQTIANNYHTELELLRQANRLQSDVIAPGQGLVVPLYLHRRYHTIQADTNLNNPLIVAAQGNTGNSAETIEHITMQDILSGHLNAATSTLNQPLPPLEEVPNLTEAPRLAEAADQGINTSANLDAAAAPLSPSMKFYSQPIHAHDNLQTILNKLYSHNN